MWFTCEHLFIYVCKLCIFFYCTARTKTPLASVPITLEGKTMSLEEIDAKFTVLLPYGISNLTPVQWGRATVGKNGQLINVQDYIEYNSQASTSV